MQTLRQTITALKNNLELVDVELNKNKTLAQVYSAIDPTQCYKLDKAREDLNLVAVDLYQQLSDAEKQENDLINEFNKMV